MIKAYILIHTAVGRAAEAQGNIASISGVSSADVVSGAYDVIAEVQGGSLQEIRDHVVMPIEAIEGVLRAVLCPTGSHEPMWEELLEPAFTAR